jgi:CRISPR-associated protein (TIGR03986 family)
MYLVKKERIMLPQHTNPTETRLTTRGSVRKQVSAVAPYNFVPLPSQTVVADTPPAQNGDLGFSGYITCRLKTLTPLYTRAAMSADQYRQWAGQIREMMADEALRREYAQFFHVDDKNRPVIPGSSLRGMIRSLMEIICFGRFQSVTEKQLFFRTMDNSSVGDHYRSRMMNNVEAGVLRKNGDRYFIQKWEHVRIHRSKLYGGLYQGSGPMKTPSWSGALHQYQQVWVRLTKSGYLVDDIKDQPTAGYREGILVITGDIPKKKKEHVLLKPVSNPQEIEVHEDLVEQFQDDDQVTLWQQKAFPMDQPTSGGRERKGLLRKGSLLETEGDPVFFLRENGKLSFFGRAAMFRLPYTNAPADHVPERVRRMANNTDAEIVDLVDAIFGYIAEEERTHGAAGRVFFGDAHCTSTKDIWLKPNEEVTTPAILSSPKPTSFQHYLVQDKTRHPAGSPGEAHDPDVKDALAHYGTPTPTETIVRGHKLYWHKEGTDSVTPESIQAQDSPINWSNDTQHTQIRPVNAGVSFEFRVYFDNLRDHELGALLWALRLPMSSNGNLCRHKLGMGKPLGLGSVKLGINVTTVQRRRRYKQLFHNDDWFYGETTAHEIQSDSHAQDEISIEKFMTKFEEYLLSRLYPNKAERPARLAHHPRMVTLAALLAWPGPSNYLTRYMEIRRVDPGDTDANWYNEFQARPVLPDPLHITDSLNPDSGRKREVAFTGPKLAYRDNNNHGISQPSVIDPNKVLNQLSKKSDDSDADPITGHEPSTPKETRDLQEGQIIWTTVVRTSFNASYLEAGETGMEGKLPDTEMTDEARSDIPGHFTPGKKCPLWIREVNVKRKRLTFTMKDPKS